MLYKCALNAVTDPNAIYNHSCHITKMKQILEHLLVAIRTIQEEMDDEQEEMKG
jgi:hypothetical protein